MSSVPVALVVAALVPVGPVVAAGVSTALVPVLGAELTVPRVPAGAVSEATVAIGACNPRRMAVATKPYVAPTWIQISVSEDAGQYFFASSERRSTGREE